MGSKSLFMMYMMTHKKKHSDWPSQIDVYCYTYYLNLSKQGHYGLDWGPRRENWKARGHADLAILPNKTRHRPCPHRRKSHHPFGMATRPLSPHWERARYRGEKITYLKSRKSEKTKKKKPFTYLLRVIIIQRYHFFNRCVGVDVTPSFSSSRTSIASSTSTTKTSSIFFEDILKHSFIFNLDFGDHITRHITRAFTTFAPVKTIGIFISNDLKILHEITYFIIMLMIINGSNFWMKWINNKKYEYLILSTSINLR